MKNINNIEQNQEQDPLANFNIYYDGQIDRIYAFKRDFGKVMAKVGEIAYNGLEIALNGLEDMHPTLNRK